MRKKLQIFARQPRLPGDLSEHDRPNFFRIAESPGVFTQRGVHELDVRRTLRGFNFPPKCEEGSKDLASFRTRPVAHFSGSNEAHFILRQSFFFDLVGDHAKREGLDSQEGFFARLTIGHYARKFRNLGNPPSVLL